MHIWLTKQFETVGKKRRLPPKAICRKFLKVTRVLTNVNFSKVELAKIAKIFIWKVIIQFNLNKRENEEFCALPQKLCFVHSVL